MSEIIDCATCGAPLASERRCCPHCHCKNAAWHKWALVAALGAASCHNNEPIVAYGPPPIEDLAGVDQSVPRDLAVTDDLAKTPDGGDGGE